MSSTGRQQSLPFWVFATASCTGSKITQGTGSATGVAQQRACGPARPLADVDQSAFVVRLATTEAVGALAAFLVACRNKG
ncbi:hypothetical protein ACWDZ4_34390 [Streptomyces sp. NPDC003016]